MHGYAAGLAWAGGGALVIGLISVLGGWESTRSAMYQYGSTAGEPSAAERARREMGQEEQGFGFLVRMGMVAGLLFATALGIEAFTP